MSALGGGEDRPRSGAADRRLPGRFVLELGIIFVGVFGAFIAEDLRQQREDDQRAEQIYEALLGEVQTFVERAPAVVAGMQANVDTWQARHAAGDQPPPPYYREPRAEAPPTAIWEATLASGGVALLEPELFNELALFYNRLVSVSDRYRRYNEVTERELIPYLSADPSRFYEDDGSLRGLYRWQIEFLDEIRVELELLTEEGRLVQERIAGELDR